jgi:general secretion pathway protein G
MNNPIEKQFWDCKHSFSDFAYLKRLNRNGWNRGFTLIELFIVIAIIGTLSAIAIPNYLRYRNQAKIMLAITDIQMIGKQIALFVIDNDGQYPNSLSNLPNISVPNDPWGNPYQYLRIDGAILKGKGKIKPRKDHNTHPVNSDYDLYSMGKDGKSNEAFTAGPSQDDIVRANDGEYVGLVSNY